MIILTRLAAARREGQVRGVYSVCSAHPLVIEAAMLQAQIDGTPVLIEATSNQVDQFGGYTGMRPEDFRRFVFDIAARVGFDAQQVLLGGDHLGPNPWRERPAEEAMQLAEGLLASFAEAGFVKLHLDASMPCAGDPPRLGDDVVAERAARLCHAAERAATTAPVYVIGTEVPVPGGSVEGALHLRVTSREDARQTVKVHRDCFGRAGLGGVWPRVIALVVQPGVEFDHDSVLDYRPEAARALSALLDDEPGFVFEAHSTDYQQPHALARLVHDGFAILKVGPALTFALREALYALSSIEAVLLPPEQQARLPECVERVMFGKPGNWQRYYEGSPEEQARLRVYSYSDRIRYYWSEPAIEAAVQQLMANLSQCQIPETVLSQFMPGCYRAWRAGRIKAEPRALAVEHVREALRPYAAACRSSADVISEKSKSRAEPAGPA